MEYETSEEITESQLDEIECDMCGKIVAACENSGLDEASIDAILNEAKLRFKYEYDGNFGHGAFRQATLEDLRDIADGVVRRALSELSSDSIEEEVFEESVEIEEIQEVQETNNIAPVSKPSSVATIVNANAMLDHDFKSLGLDELVIQFEFKRNCYKVEFYLRHTAVLRLIKNLGNGLSLPAHYVLVPRTNTEIV